MKTTLLALLGTASISLQAADNSLTTNHIFPPEAWHNHGSCIVETPDGSLLACWFHGSGERKADDVEILGARKPAGATAWSKPFPMADTPGFPDTNGCMIIDPEQRLWLLWPTIQANTWESALMKIRTSTDYQQRDATPPVWATEKVLHIKPGDQFEPLLRKKTAAYLNAHGTTPEAIQWANHNFTQAADKLTRRLGWFTRAHPHITPAGRLIVGLYSDGFSVSLAAYTDDLGATWSVSEPIVGGANIQPSFARRRDGSLLAFMRDNGPPPKRVHVSSSPDNGQTWSPVTDHPQLANPGAGLELTNLRDGRMLVAYNDTEQGRHQLAVAVSGDDGLTFPHKRYIEKAEPGAGRYHYPSVIQTRDGLIHLTYSAFETDPATGKELKSIKHATLHPDSITSP